jgi:hypothetical protein
MTNTARNTIQPGQFSRVLQDDVSDLLGGLLASAIALDTGRLRSDRLRPDGSGLLERYYEVAVALVRALHFVLRAWSIQGPERSPEIIERPDLVTSLVERILAGPFAASPCEQHVRLTIQAWAELAGVEPRDVSARVFEWLGEEGRWEKEESIHGCHEHCDEAVISKAKME